MNRDQSWLEGLLADIWVVHFGDVPRRRELRIIFGRCARTRLGSLSYSRRNRHATLRVNGLFKEPFIPEYIVKATIVHELCHYAHGFHSGHSRRYKHPHAGGVIKREFAARGLGDLFDKQKRWLSRNWTNIVNKHCPSKRRSTKRHFIVFR